MSRLSRLSGGRSGKSTVIQDTGISSTSNSNQRTSATIQESWFTSRLQKSPGVISTIVEIYENLSGSYEYIDSLIGDDRFSFHIERQEQTEPTYYVDELLVLIDRGLNTLDQFLVGFESISTFVESTKIDRYQPTDRATKETVKSLPTEITKGIDYISVVTGKLVTDRSTLTDDRSHMFGKAIQDTARASDSILRQVDYVRGILDVTRHQDQFIKSVQRQTVDRISLSETIQILLTLTYLLYDSQVVSDSATKAIGKNPQAESTFLRDLVGKSYSTQKSDSVRFSDSISLTRELVKMITDTGVVLDYFALNTNQTKRDSMYAQDRKLMSVSRTSRDSVSHGDVISIVIGLLREFADLIYGNDRMLKETGKNQNESFYSTTRQLKNIGRVTTDSTQAGDFLNIQRLFGRTFADFGLCDDFGQVANQGYVTDNQYSENGYVGTLTEF